MKSLPPYTQPVIPPLPKNQNLKSQKGTYRIISDKPFTELEKIRFYQGIQVINNKSLVIKEYLLPEGEFNDKEVNERKDKFEELTNVNLKNKGGQDFRLVVPYDAIAPRDERRCYLITQPINNAITLREYLKQLNSPLNSKQVREVLKQVLQTLWFLHTQKVRLPNGEVLYGLAHGNLSLDSLLIVTHNQQFFIYLCDLALWEDLFKSPTAKITVHSPEQDLQDLGRLSLYLLWGADQHPDNGKPIDYKNEQHWSQVQDITLNIFIRRLLGIDTPFTDPREALHTLLVTESQSETQKAEQPIIQELESEIKPAKTTINLLKVILICLSLGFLGSLTFRLVWSQISTAAAEISGNKTSQTAYSLIKDVTDVPTGKFQYTSAKSEGTWGYLMTTPGLLSPNNKFDKVLRERGMKLQLNYKSVNSLNEALNQIEKKKVDFFITQHAGNFGLPLQDKQLTSETIAYEGIVIFVPFSDSQREGSIPQGLNGKISLEQLRRLYSGQITNWKELDNKLPDLPVKLYIPIEKAVVQRFKEIIFKNYPLEAERFQRLIDQKIITEQETINTLRSNILADFENRKNGGVGFGLLSKVYNQCSVYPLSVGEKGKEVQPLVQNNGEDINPKLDLCNDKGSYKPNAEAFSQQRYLFVSPIAVVYPDDAIRSQAGKSFAKILKTDEGQKLLEETGLIPQNKK
jgi:serine/threonine protein kinase